MTSVNIFVLCVFNLEMVRQVGATECKYKSHLFKGMCFNKDKCYFICQSEGFERGQCEGIRRRCMCTKTCGAPPSVPEPPPYVEEPRPYAEEPPSYAEEPLPLYEVGWDGGRRGGGGKD